MTIPDRFGPESRTCLELGEARQNWECRACRNSEDSEVSRGRSHRGISGRASMSKSVAGEVFLFDFGRGRKFLTPRRRSRRGPAVRRRGARQMGAVRTTLHRAHTIVGHRRAALTSGSQATRIARGAPSWRRACHMASVAPTAADVEPWKHFLERCLGSARASCARHPGGGLGVVALWPAQARLASRAVSVGLAVPPLWSLPLRGPRPSTRRPPTRRFGPPRRLDPTLGVEARGDLLLGPICRWLGRPFLVL